MAKVAPIADRCGKHIEGNVLIVIGEEPGNFPSLGNVFRSEGVDPDRPGIGFIVCHLPGEHIRRLADDLTGSIVAPDRNVDAVIDLPRYRFQAVGGNRPMRDRPIADLAQIRHQRGFCAGQDGEGYAALFFRLKKLPPGLFVGIFNGKLLLAGEIIASFAANIAAVAHVIGGFAQEKIAANFFPTLSDQRICDYIGEFVVLRLGGHLFFAVEFIDDVLGDDAHGGQFGIIVFVDPYPVFISQN
ncbi:MAG: hypothetical protein ACD_75C00044G0004 [uncultured bacterium]|nr:MAG: hypothetical protein ACD_75C00044G0004 [uncultured bacterium]